MSSVFRSSLWPHPQSFSRGEGGKSPSPPGEGFRVRLQTTNDRRKLDKEG